MLLVLSSSLFLLLVSAAGDFNGDGYGDIITSALNRNKCYLIYGSEKDFKNIYLNDLRISQGFAIVASGSASSLFSFGISLSSIGDYNGDGLDDIAITAMGRSGANVVFIYFGNVTFHRLFSLSSSNFPSITYDLSRMKVGQDGFIIRSPLYSFAGLSISWLGDVNGDNYDDMAIGSVPFMKASVSQVSYILYGKASNISSVRLENLRKEDGMIITGAGIVVSGLGDINEDGIADITVSQFSEWQVQSSSYIIALPFKITVFPSGSPSSLPSSSFPTSFPSSLIPTYHPSRIPVSTASLIPTLAVSVPTRIPTIAPSGPTIAPSFSPTVSPTVFPSRAPRQPSVKPSARPVVLKIPSVLPTVSPSIHSTRFPSWVPVKMSSFPTALPTFSPSVSFSSPIDTVLITTGGDYFGDEGNQIFLIKANEETRITGNVGRKTFVIFPVNATLTITDFDIMRDVIDLTNVPGTSVNYISPPLTLILSNGQKIILSSHEDYDLNSENIIFPAIDSSSSASSSSKPSLSGMLLSLPFLDRLSPVRSIVTPLFFCFGVMLLSAFCCCGCGSKREYHNKEKKRHKIEEMNYVHSEKSAVHRLPPPSFPHSPTKMEATTTTRSTPLNVRKTFVINEVENEEDDGDEDEEEEDDDEEEDENDEDEDECEEEDDDSDYSSEAVDRSKSWASAEEECLDNMEKGAAEPFKATKIDSVPRISAVQK
jgi:hypothetical protein